MNNNNQTGLSNEQVSEVIKQKHKRPNRSEALMPHYEPGEMATMITHSMYLSNLGPVDMTDPDAVQERVNQFLTYCIQNDVKPTVESMALAFNTNRVTLWRWKEGVESSHIPDTVRNIIKKGYSIMNDLLTQTMANGKMNPVSAIFLLKNNHGYKDQTDVVVTPNNPMQDLDADQARKRLIDAIPADENE